MMWSFLVATSKKLKNKANKINFNSMFYSTHISKILSFPHVMICKIFPRRFPALSLKASVLCPPTARLHQNQSISSGPCFQTTGSHAEVLGAYEVGGHYAVCYAGRAQSPCLHGRKPAAGAFLNPLLWSEEFCASMP